MCLNHGHEKKRHETILKNVHKVIFMRTTEREFATQLTLSTIQHIGNRQSPCVKSKLKEWAEKIR